MYKYDIVEINGNFILRKRLFGIFREELYDCLFDEWRFLKYYSGFQDRLTEKFAMYSKENAEKLYEFYTGIRYESLKRKMKVYG